jgi:hypothetical protein
MGFSGAWGKLIYEKKTEVNSLVALFLEAVRLENFSYEVKVDQPRMGRGQLKLMRYSRHQEYFSNRSLNNPRRK